MHRKSKYFTFAFILLLSFIAFGVFGYLTYTGKPFEMVGYGLVVARGSASALLVMSVLMLFFISYDVLTWVRATCLGGVMTAALDLNVLNHQFCAYLVIFYSIIHTAAHLIFTYPKMSSVDLNYLNAHLTHATFTEEPTYVDLLFKSWAGLTGIGLCIVLILMPFFSQAKIRHKCF